MLIGTPEFMAGRRLTAGGPSRNLVEHVLIGQPTTSFGERRNAAAQFLEPCDRELAAYGLTHESALANAGSRRKIAELSVESIVDADRQSSHVLQRTTSPPSRSTQRGLDDRVPGTGITAGCAREVIRSGAGAVRQPGYQNDEPGFLRKAISSAVEARPSDWFR